MALNRQYPLVHHETVLATGTKQLAFEQPESFVDFSEANETGVRFHLDIHGTTGTFDSFKVKCKFQIGMPDVNGAGFTQFRWYDLQPEQIKTMIAEGVDWYAGATPPSSATNLLTNPSWEKVSSGGLTSSGAGGVTTDSRPTDGGYRGSTYRRATWTTGTTAPSGGQTHGSAEVTGGKTYSLGIRFAPSRAQRFRVAFRWYSGTTALSYDYSPSATYEATTIRNAHRITHRAVAPANATSARITLEAVAGEGAVNWQAGDTLDIDSGMIVEGSFLPADFDGDSTGAVWNGAAHESTSTITLPSDNEPNIVARSSDTLPITVSRAIKGFGQLVRLQVKPEFVNGDANAGIVYSLIATH